MKLAAKLMVVFLVAVILMTAMGSYYTVQRAYERFDQQQREITRETAAAVEGRLAQAWREGGEAGLNRAITAMQLGAQPSIRWVWFERTQFRNGRAETTVVEALQFDQRQSASRMIRDETGRTQLHTYHPIELDNGPRGGLEITGSTDILDAELRETITSALVSLGAMATVSVGLVYLAGVRWVARPLTQLIEKTERIGRGDFTGPLDVKTSDELSDLAVALNSMAAKLADQQDRLEQETNERMATLEQLRHMDRLKTVGKLASGLAHELGTPLNVVSGRAELIASGKLNHEEIENSARTIKSESERITTIIRQMLDFARPGAVKREPVELAVVTKQTIDLLRPIAAKRDVQFREDLPPGLFAMADRSQLQQVLSNVLVNAIQSMRSGGEVHVSMRRATAAKPGDSSAAGKGVVAISIRDQGGGIAEEDRKHLFEPFFTTKDVGEGTGLGLSIAFGIVQEHDGWIDVESEPGVGSCFTINLPESQAE